MILQCQPRSEKALTDVVKALHPATNPLYAPAQAFTWCNAFARDACAALGAPFPRQDMLANEQIDWLDSEPGRAAGWHECSVAKAVHYANAGLLVLATYRNAKIPPTGHSHIALCVPSLGEAPNIAQAGARNFESEPLVRGFGSFPVRFFEHF